MKPLHLEVRHWLHEQGFELTPDQVQASLSKKQEWIDNLTPEIANVLLANPNINRAVKGLVKIIMKVKNGQD